MKKKLLAFAPVALASLVGNAEITSKKPNVVFILADDHNYSSINALGNSEIQTPNIDTFVNRGTSFTNTHIFGANSAAVCAPSRAMLLTGRTFNELPKGFVLAWKGKKEDRGVCPYKTFPEVFKENGYRTFGTGKQHNGSITFARGFTDGGNIFFGGMHSEKSGGHLKPLVQDFDPTGEYPSSAKHVKKVFSTEIYTDASLKFINEYKDSKPFMMYVAYTAPHDPRMAPQKYIDMYPADKISLPKNYLSKHPFKLGTLGIRDERLAPYPRQEASIKKEIGGYYAMITHMDDQIGRIIKAIEAKGEMDNTIFIFAGDNGLAMGQHGLIGKQNLYEHSIRVPLIFAGPGIDKGVKNNGLTYLHDIFPTMCGLIGAEIPESISSKSLMPLLSGAKKEIYESQFYCFGNIHRAVRLGDWKLIRYNVKRKQTTQLFNVANDPLEVKNLATSPEYRAKVEELNKLLSKSGEALGDTVNWYK